MWESIQVSRRLESHANGKTAASRRREIQPLRGVRGVSDGDLARVIAQSFKQAKLDLDRDADELHNLFSTAFEDGIAAIALTAACLPDDPEAALETGLDWLTSVDDTLTADALGSLLLGPGVLAAKRDPQNLLRLTHDLREPAKRAVAAAAFAWLGTPLTGPALAALREKLGTAQIQFTEQPLDDLLTDWAQHFLRDGSPAVRKALRHMLRDWTRSRPSAVVAWADSVRGGIPKMLGAEVDKARRILARDP